MKKSLCFIIALAMLTSLTACGGASEDLTSELEAANAEIETLNFQIDEMQKTIDELIAENERLSVQPDIASPELNVSAIIESNSATSSEADSSENDTLSYNRQNPAPIGTEQTIDVEGYDGNYNITMCVRSVVRGQAAYDLLIEANQFNDPAPEGMEYIVADVSATVNSTENDQSVYLDSYEMTCFSSSGSEYDLASVVCPDPEFYGEVYSGGTLEGYCAFLVSVDDAAPVFAFGRDYNGTGGMWFSIAAQDGMSTEAMASSDSPAGQGPESGEDAATSDNDTLSIDLCVSAIEMTLSEYYGSNYSVSVAENIVVINIWQDGIAAGVVFAQAGMQDYIDDWNDLVESMDLFEDSVQSVLDENGHDDYSVMLNILNDMNTENVFLVISKDSVLYDIVNNIDILEIG